MPYPTPPLNTPSIVARCAVANTQARIELRLLQDAVRTLVKFSPLFQGKISRRILCRALKRLVKDIDFRLAALQREILWQRDALDQFYGLTRDDDDERKVTS